MYFKCLIHFVGKDVLFHGDTFPGHHPCRSSAVEAYCLIPGTVHAPHVRWASVLFAIYEVSELGSQTPFCVPDV